MKLKELLPIITHQNYKVFVQNNLTEVTGNLLQLADMEDIKAHMGYDVLGVDQDWNIIIQGDKNLI